MNDQKLVDEEKNTAIPSGQPIKDNSLEVALRNSHLVEDIEIFQRAKEKMGHIDDKMLLWCLKGMVLLDVPMFSYQSALIDELEDRLFPEYDGDKVRLEDFGWSTPDGLIIYSDVFCTCECHREGLLHADHPCCAKCPYCFRHFKARFYDSHPATCARRIGSIQPEDDCQTTTEESPSPASLPNSESESSDASEVRQQAIAEIWNEAMRIANTCLQEHDHSTDELGERHNPASCIWFALEAAKARALKGGK